MKNRDSNVEIRDSPPRNITAALWFPLFFLDESRLSDETDLETVARA